MHVKHAHARDLRAACWPCLHPHAGLLTRGHVCQPACMHLAGTKPDISRPLPCCWLCSHGLGWQDTGVCMRLVPPLLVYAHTTCGAPSRCSPTNLSARRPAKYRPGRREHFTWQRRPVTNALLALYRMPACNIFLLNALLCVHGAHACILSCGVLLMLACSCRFSLTTLAGLHVAMLFEWCVQAFPSGHVGPPAIARNKRRLGKGQQK